MTWARTHPMQLPSGANLREHPLARAKRASMHRNVGFLLVAANAPPALPVEVLLVRIAPRALDDDNLTFAFKGIRDGVADAYGVSDRDPRITWRYAQEKGAAAIRIEIRERT